MTCQKVCEQGRDDAWKRGSTYWQSPIPTSFSHYGQTCMGVFLKPTTSSQPWQPVHGCSFFSILLPTSSDMPWERGYKFNNVHCCSLVLRPLPSSSHMAWERGYMSTNITSVASFSGHYLAPPIWPGNEATSPPGYFNLSSELEYSEYTADLW